VTSGAIARGMRHLNLHSRPKSMDELQAASAVGQGDLFRAYESRLAEHGTQSAQVLLTAADINERSHYVNARRTLKRLIKWEVVPIVNENDTTATDEITFGDNDFLAAQVAILLEAELLVLLTDLEGLHTADPKIYPDARPIQRVEQFSELEELEIEDRTSVFGSGGMKSKIAAAEMASEAGIAAVICSGIAPKTLERAAGGEPVGTRFAPRGGRKPSFKLWLKYAKLTKGCIVIDPGAAEVLLDQGSSLLPVGVVEVEGHFGAGDAIDVMANGRLIGRGISEYSAQELERVKGLKSPQARELLPHAADEVIHRDRFVLM
jgi:glutamate 5-kinase